MFRKAVELPGADDAALQLVQGDAGLLQGALQDGCAGEGKLADAERFVPLHVWFVNDISLWSEGNLLPEFIELSEAGGGEFQPGAEMLFEDADACLGGIDFLGVVNDQSAISFACCPPDCMAKRLPQVCIHIIGDGEAGRRHGERAEVGAVACFVDPDNLRQVLLLLAGASSPTLF